MFANPSYLGAWMSTDPEVIIRASAIPSVTDSLSTKEKKDYSVVRAIRAMAGLGGDAGLEREVSSAITKKLGQEPVSGGMYVPTCLRPRASGLDSKTNAAGGYAVQTDVRDLIELLRNKTKVIQIGATVLEGLSGNVQFPKQLTGSAGAWVTENPGSDVTQSDATFGALTITPKTFMGTTAFSRQLLQQSSIDIENIVRSDLAEAHALAVDAAALDGTGTSNQPLGLLRTTGIGAVTIQAGAGGVPTYSKLLDLETAIASANADSDRMALLTTPAMRGKLRKIAVLDSAYSAIPVWQNGPKPGVGDVAGYPAYVSNQVPSNKTSGSNSDCHCIILGDWSQLLLAEFGVLTLVVDPFTSKKKNMIECTSFGMYDIGVRQPAAFAAIQDARLA